MDTERRILGREKITLLNGDERETIVYAIGFVEKINIIKKYTKVNYIKGVSYKEVDEYAIMQEVLARCMPDIKVTELDYNAEKIYAKYFKPNDSEEETKKGNTSTTSLTDTQEENQT